MKNRKTVPGQLELGKLSIIEFKSNKGTKVLEFDANNLNKGELKILKRIVKENEKGNLRVVRNKEDGEKRVTYPMRGGGYATESIDFLDKALLVPASNTTQILTVYEEMKKFVPTIDMKVLVNVSSWINFAKSTGVRPPSGWGAMKPRWLKTIKIIYLSTYLDDFYSKFGRVPDIKALRATLNKIETPNTTDLIVTNDVNVVKKEAINYYKDNVLEKIAMTVYQEEADLFIGSHMAVTVEGKVNKNNLNTNVSNTELIGGKTPSVTFISTKRVETILLYTGKRDIVSTTYKKNRGILSKERLKELSQKVSIGMQYPLDYIEWK